MRMFGFGKKAKKEPEAVEMVSLDKPSSKQTKADKKSFICGGNQIFPGGHCDAIGRRPTMEDSCASQGEFAGPKTQYYAVFDGHGGRDAAVFCAENLHQIIVQGLEMGDSVPKAIKEGIKEINRQVVARWATAGTTAAIVVVMNDIIYTANVGDSRIILIDTNGKHKRLSVDHRITDKTEKKAVITRGGTITQGRVNGILMLSRAIGDGEVARYISCEPYMTETPLKEGMKLIIACDGVWDVMSDQNAVEIFNKTKDPLDAARAIKAEALRRGTSDNISIICAILRYKD